MWREISFDSLMFKKSPLQPFLSRHTKLLNNKEEGALRDETKTFAREILIKGLKKSLEKYSYFIDWYSENISCCFPLSRRIIILLSNQQLLVISLYVMKSTPHYRVKKVNTLHSNIEPKRVTAIWNQTVLVTAVATIGEKINEAPSSFRVTSENKTIHSSPTPHH